MASVEILSPEERLSRNWTSYFWQRRLTERCEVDENDGQEVVDDDDSSFIDSAQELESLDLDVSLRQLQGNNNTEYNALLSAGGASRTDHGVVAQTEVASLNHSDHERVRMALERSFPSIFHVKCEAKSKAAVRVHINKLIMEMPTTEKKEWRKKILEGLSRTTTGFVVGENQDNLFLLTCAHAFEACFNASNPISVEDLMNMFKVSVRCDHDELKYRERLHYPGNIEPRVYREVEVLEVDSQKDVLLLKVTKQGFCTEKHVVLEMADNLQSRHLELVGLVSWPFDRHRTLAMGEISHYDRRPEDIDGSNPHGYNFSAIEVDITVEAGSSGAPLIDMTSKVVGMMHSGRADGMAYFVSSSDISAKLVSWAASVAECSGSSRKRKDKEPSESNSSSWKRIKTAGSAASVAESSGSSRKRRDKEPSESNRSRRKRMK